MPPWIAGYFLNPAYVLPGAALIAAPIIIHLINRMRFRRVRFAAMEFLLASQQRNRRRLLLEQLLLLMLRILLVAAMVALIARPLIDPQQLALFQGQKAHHYVLIDDSGSMQDRWGDTTAFKTGLEVVQKLAAEGARRPGTQTLTVALLSRPLQPLVTLENLDPAFVTRFNTLLENLNCSHRALDLASGIDAGLKLLQEQPGAMRTFHLISDFRRPQWDQANAVPTALRELDQAGIAINLVRSVPARNANLGLVELSGSVDVAAANVPLRLKVGVKNYGDQVARNVRLTVLADGAKLPVSVAIDALEAGREVTREFDVVFPTTGPHEIRVVLPADALTQDNERYLAFNIADSNPVLIIDGDGATGDAFYLQDALAPAPGLTGFAPTIETADYLRRQPLDRYQAVFLLNVAELHPEALRALENYVAAGGGLAWFLGEQVRPAYYNDKLYKAGKGLFPARLGSVTELIVDEEQPAPDLEFNAHPVFRVFEGQDNPFVDSVRVERYFTVEKGWQPADGVQVIGRLRNQAPMFFEHRFGKGTIVTSLTSCGTTWNNWPRNPSYVIMQLELEKHIARSEHTLDSRVVGEPIRVAMDLVSFSPNVEVLLPNNASERLTAVAGTAPNDPSAPEAKAPAPPKPGDKSGPGASEKPQYTADFRNTDVPGLYTVKLVRKDGGEELQRFAYNVPESESDLELVSSERLRERIGPDVRVQIQEVGNFEWIHGKESEGQEIMDAVLLLLLAFLVCEQLLALKLSYHPQTAGARA